MQIKECIDDFKAYIKSYVADETFIYYENNINFFVDFLDNLISVKVVDDINSITKQVYIDYISYQRKRNITNTSVRTYARAIKVFLRYCYNEGYMLIDVTKGVKFPKSDKRIVKPLSSSEVVKIHKHICKSSYPLRNLCIFYLMLDCGLRRGEVIRLDLDDIDLEHQFISIVNSKGSKSRVIPMSYRVHLLLTNYIKETPKSRSAALILDKNNERRISKSAINCIFYRLKVAFPNIYPHLLRHTFGTSFILGGGSLEVLRLLMGHSDYEVTREYVHIANQCKILNYDIYKLDDVYFKYCNYNYKE